MSVEYDPLDYTNIGKSVVRALLEKPAQGLTQDLDIEGAGIYALYYTGRSALYRLIADPSHRVPIYVGKAVYGGRRKGAVTAVQAGRSQPLAKRLGEHAWSITKARNLALKDFWCKVLVVKQVWIPLAERILIEIFRPVWNAAVDGFGNHAPGAGRTAMRRPKWDTLHPGRPWARPLKPEHTAEGIRRAVEQHLHVQQRRWEEAPPWEL